MEMLIQILTRRIWYISSGKKRKMAVKNYCKIGSERIAYTVYICVMRIPLYAILNTIYAIRGSMEVEGCLKKDWLL